jgi:hypothetical protein
LAFPKLSQSLAAPPATVELVPERRIDSVYTFYVGYPVAGSLHCCWAGLHAHSDGAFEAYACTRSGTLQVVELIYEREYCTALLSPCGLTDPTVSCSPTNLCKSVWGPVYL